NGFFSVFATSVSLRDEAERRRFLEIVVDEAGDRICVSTGAGGGTTLETSITSIRQAEEIGCTHVMYGLPGGPGLETEAAVLERARQVIDATDLGIVLYIRNRERFTWARRGGVPVEVFRQLSALPNVVGAKITQVLDPVSTFECAAE